MKCTTMTMMLTATLLTGCGTNYDNGHNVPNYVVHHPNESVPAATLHTEASATMQVPNAEYRSMDVAVIKINNEPIQTTHPIIIPTGVHNLTFRCELRTGNLDATQSRIFTGQSQWFLKAHATYTLVPAFEIDDYDNPICTAKLATQL